MSLASITRWHVVISGFTQTESRWHGMVKLWREMHARSTAAEDVVSLRTWNSNWRALAEHIFLVQQEQGTRIKVACYGYSWGCSGLVKLARELNKRGIPVESMVLSDPIYLSPLLPFRWLAMTNWRPVVIPANVRMVRWFFQRQNLPQSPGIIASDKNRTMIFEPTELDRQHEYCDDSNQFHDACHAAAEALWSA